MKTVLLKESFHSVFILTAEGDMPLNNELLQLFVSDGTTLHSILNKPSLLQRRAVQ